MRDGTRSGEPWGKWWPDLSGQGRVPEALFEAYDQALENVYKARSATPARLREFERKLTELDPPGLDVSFVKDGYWLYRSAVINIAYGFGFGKWFGMLACPVRPHDVHAVAMQALPRGQTDLRAAGRSGRMRIPSAHGSRLCRCRSMPVPSTRSSSASGRLLTSKGVKERSIAGIVVSGLVTLAPSATPSRHASGNVERGALAAAVRGAARDCHGHS